MEIPTQTPYTIRKGDSGYPVWALQRALNGAQSLAILEDGSFGGQTERAVIRFQQWAGLVGDAKFGPKSSARMARTLEQEVKVTLPDGLLHGLVAGESGDLIGAVNWGSPGGVDCGYCQRRVYTADQSNEAVVKRAFDGLYQMTLLGDSLRHWHDEYLGRSGVQTNKKAWRLAVLRHNYPYASDKLSWGPWETSYATSPQQWVLNIGAKFDDGEPVETPREWAAFYMNKMTQFVETWTP